jgi:Tol biopolymer transport system component
VLDLYARGLGGEGARAPLLSSNAHKHPTDWSSDGRFVLYTSNGDVWALPLAGDHTLIPVAQTAFREGGGRFSPDGRWIAYQSNETGRAEIYVQPFPGPGPKSKVSSGGGVIPEWRADGRELFYLAPDDQLMAVSIAFGTETTRYSKPIALFTLPPTPKTVELRQGAQYSAMADGQHFLVNKILVEPPPITLLLNWKPPSAAARR